MKYYDANDRLVIRERVGNIEESEYGIKSISTSIQRSPVVEFEDGSKVVFDWKWLASQAIKMKENEKHLKEMKETKKTD